MPTVSDINEYLAAIAPVAMKMEFDNVGLLVGFAKTDVSKILVSLDITHEVITEALDVGAQLIVSHHPLFFSLKSVTDTDTTGRKITRLLAGGVSAICMHTNLDAAHGGVNDALAAAAGIIHSVSAAETGGAAGECKATGNDGQAGDGGAAGLLSVEGYIEPTSGAASEKAPETVSGATPGTASVQASRAASEKAPETASGTTPGTASVPAAGAASEKTPETVSGATPGTASVQASRAASEKAPETTPAGEPYSYGRVGYLKNPCRLDEYLSMLKIALKTDGLRYYDAKRDVYKVAVVGGSGGGDLHHAIRHGCDTFVTADIKYDVFLEAKEQGINLIDGDHFCTENLVTGVIAAKLREAFPGVDITVSSRHRQTVEFY